MSVSSGGSSATPDDLRRWWWEPTVLECFRAGVLLLLLGDVGKIDAGADDDGCFTGGKISTAISILAVEMSDAAAAWCDK